MGNVCPVSMSIRANIVKGNIMKIVEANVEKMETELKQWGAKLDKLVAKVEAAGSAKWGIFKTGVETAWNDLETSFKKLTKHSAGAEGGQPNQGEPENEENI
jgi:hypothetical protein